MSATTLHSWISSPWRWSIPLLLVMTLMLQAADLKVETRLVWGTNEDKSPNPQHKPLDQELAKKLRNVHKWKNYFEVTHNTSMVSSRASKRIKLSEKCEIEITELEGPRIEVKLFGEGKAINKITRSLQKGECFWIGGDDRNETAWFIMITLLDEIQVKNQK